MHLKLTPASMEKDEIAIARVQSEEEDSQTSLRPYDILSYPADFTLELLVNKWNDREINSPSLQRRYVWPMARASKLIESFLLGLPVPPIFVYQSREDNSLLVVDGHQRIRSIAYFFSGWFGEENDPSREPFKLVGLNIKSPYLGVDFDHLKNTDPGAINRLKNSVLRAFIMKQVQPADDTSIIEIFERLNTGGMALHGQEIRNCIYEGVFNELLKTLNKNHDWRRIVGTTVEDKRMRDVELILRFFALFYNSSKYEKPMKLFLHNFMSANRRAPLTGQKELGRRKREYDKRMADFAALFMETANSVITYLGPKPFHILRGLNAAVFDSVFTAFAKNLDRVESESPRTPYINQVKAKFRKLLSDKKYIKLVSSATTDNDVVTKRLKMAEKVLFG